MSVLSAETQKQVEHRLVEDKLITAQKLKELNKEAHDKKFLVVISCFGWPHQQ